MASGMCTLVYITSRRLNFTRTYTVFKAITSAFTDRNDITTDTVAVTCARRPAAPAIYSVRAFISRKWSARWKGSRGESYLAEAAETSLICRRKNVYDAHAVLAVVYVFFLFFPCYSAINHVAINKRSAGGEWVTHTHTQREREKKQVNFDLSPAKCLRCACTPRLLVAARVFVYPRKDVKSTSPHVKDTFSFLIWTGHRSAAEIYRREKTSDAKTDIRL